MRCNYNKNERRHLVAFYKIESFNNRVSVIEAYPWDGNVVKPDPDGKLYLDEYGEIKLNPLEWSDNRLKDTYFVPPTNSLIDTDIEFKAQLTYRSWDELENNYYKGSGYLVVTGTGWYDPSQFLKVGDYIVRYRNSYTYFKISKEYFEKHILPKPSLFQRFLAFTDKLSTWK